MSCIHIPFLSKSEQGRPLQAALDYTASHTGLSTFTVALAMSHFLESIADEVARGRTVRIPGFGIFAPVLDERRQYLARRGGPKCLPKFSAAKGFRSQVMWSAPPTRSGKDALRAHRSNHRVSEERYTSARVFTSMQVFRDQVAAQMGHADRKSLPRGNG